MRLEYFQHEIFRVENVNLWWQIFQTNPLVWKWIIANENKANCGNIQPRQNNPWPHMHASAIKLYLPLSIVGGWKSPLVLLPSLMLGRIQHQQTWLSCDCCAITPTGAVQKQVDNFGLYRLLQYNAAKHIGQYKTNNYIYKVSQNIVPSACVLCAFYNILLNHVSN